MGEEILSLPLCDHLSQDDTLPKRLPDLAVQFQGGCAPNEQGFWKLAPVALRKITVKSLFFD